MPDQEHASPPRFRGVEDLTVTEMVEPEVPERFRWLAGLLAARGGDRVADLGCGTGSALAMVASTLPAPAGALIGLDLTGEALHQAMGRLGAARWLLVRADLTDRVPLGDASMDRVLCHNVLEIMPDPAALVTDARRILRPGGRLVLSHSDFDTLLFASEDLAVTRRLARAYCDTRQDWMEAVDGTIGRRLPEIAAGCGFQLVDVQARVNLSRRFQPGELGYGYAYNLALVLHRSGQASAGELNGWLAGLRRLDDRGAFLFSLNDYAVVAVRPGGEVA